MLNKIFKKKINFSKYIWDGSFENLDRKKIYAYYEPKSHGIYKYMSFFIDGSRFHFFARIDNEIGYCLFKEKTIKDLFIFHYTHSINRNLTIYEFNNTRSFFKWCLNHKKLT